VKAHRHNPRYRSRLLWSEAGYGVGACHCNRCARVHEGLHMVVAEHFGLATARVTLKRNGEGMVEHKTSIFAFPIARWRKIAVDLAPALVADLCMSDVDHAHACAESWWGQDRRARTDYTRARNWLARNRVWIVREARRWAAGLRPRYRRGRYVWRPAQ